MGKQLFSSPPVQCARRVSFDSMCRLDLEICQKSSPAKGSLENDDDDLGHFASDPVM